MKNYAIVSLCFLILLSVPITQATAQRKKGKDAKPKWIDYSYRKASYPRGTYVFGFTSESSSSYADEKELFDQLKSYARNQLVESIYTNIKATTSSSLVVENRATAELFRKSSVSFSNVNISGLTIETYLDEKARLGYAFAYAKKSDISQLYRTTVANKKSELDSKVAMAEQFVANGDNQTALNTYFGCYTLLREIEEAQTLLIAFEKLSAENPGLFTSEVNAIKTKIATAVSSIRKSESLSLDDVGYIMSFALKLQLSELEEPVRLTNFTFEDSKVATQLSKRFSTALEKKLSQQSVPVTSVAVQGQKNRYMLTGTYWEEGENLKIIAIVRDLVDGKALASAEAMLPTSWVTKNGINYKPEKKELDKLAKFNEDYVISEGGLVVNLTTNKGADNLIFSKGEILKLYIKANQSCYVQFIYHLADGQRVLLYDNYYISTDMVNKLIEIPQHFECSDPFGVETLQLNAQSQKFAPLQVKEQYGYKFITDGLGRVLATTRGFKPVSNKDAKAETRLLITTMAE